MLRIWVFIGSLNMLLSVALGAFGAHGLEGMLTQERMGTYETSVQYHMIHAVALILIGLIGDRFGEVRSVKWSGRLIFTGIVIFSGSLYVLSLTGITWLGAVTPIGGASFLAGWGTLAMTAWTSNKT